MSETRLGRYRVGGMINRALLECLADANWLYTKSDRALAYIKSVKSFGEHMTTAAPTLLQDIPVDIKKKAEWSSSEIQHRIDVLGEKPKFLYDYYSYFTHVSPAFFSFGYVDPGYQYTEYSLTHHAVASFLNISLVIESSSTIFNTYEGLQINSINTDYMSLPSRIDN